VEFRGSLEPGGQSGAALRIDPPHTPVDFQRARRADAARFWLWSVVCGAGVWALEALVPALRRSCDTTGCLSITIVTAIGAASRRQRSC